MGNSMTPAELMNSKLENLPLLFVPLAQYLGSDSFYDFASHLQGPYTVPQSGVTKNCSSSHLYPIYKLKDHHNP